MKPSTPPDKLPRISLVAALARNRVIGRENTLPWRIPEDLRRFKALTLGHPVIMGRKTFESIVAALGKPLPGRTNIVISRSGAHPMIPGVHMAGSLEEAVSAAGNVPEVFVIGGAEIYALALPRAERLHFTEILTAVEGDTFFPAIEAGDWREASREHGSTGGALPFDFVTYERRRTG